MRVTVWNEYRHELKDDNVKLVYPKGIHNCIAEFLKAEGHDVKTATLDETQHGLTQEVIDNTDVLIWWGHMHHGEVSDEVVKRVTDAVLKGMGMIFLHSAHHSKPFKALMGTTCNLSWREDGDFERVWVVDPSHPITKGIDRYFELAHEETYAEQFDIPAPEQLVLVGWFEGGEVFRSGCCYTRGLGRIFYFQPGHESYPTFYDKNVQTVIKNAVNWAMPTRRIDELICPKVEKPIKSV